MITLFDLRGLIIHSLHSGVDNEGRKTKEGTKLNGVGHCVDNFVTNFLLPATEYSRLDEIIAVTDAGNEYRKALYPEYKANRKSTDVEISDRINECTAAVTSLLKGVGVTIAYVPGFEADDVLAYLVKHLKGGKMLHTVDQDLIQLASQSCGVWIRFATAPTYKVYNTTKPKKLLMEVLPRHLALYKSIVGDASDNYGGVKGLGPAKFVHLAETFGLDGLDELAHVVNNDDYEGVLKEAIEQTTDPVLLQLYKSRDEWKLSWKLANLAPELIEARSNNRFNRIIWVNRVPSKQRIVDLLRSVECDYLLEALLDFLPTQELVTADNPPDLSALKEAIQESPFVALDWETTDHLKHEPFTKASRGREFVDMLSSTITGLGLTYGNNLQYTKYFSFGHADTNNLSGQSLMAILDCIPDEKPVAIQNAMFELTLLKNTFNRTIKTFYDTKVMASYVNENLSAGLKESSKTYLNYDQIKYRDVIEKGKTMADYSAEHVFQYGADDPLVTAHLFSHYKRVMEIEGTWEFCRDNEFGVIDLLSDGFIAGVSVDWDELARQAVEDRENYIKAILDVRKGIKENQTPTSIASGVARLLSESGERAKASARVSAEKRGISVSDTVVADLEKKLYQAVTYEDREETTITPEADLVLSTVRPILAALSLPELSSIKELPQYILKARNEFDATAFENKEKNIFLELLSEAIPHNKTNKPQGLGRTHPKYEAFKDFCVKRMKSKMVITGTKLNLDSPVQMNTLLYGILDLPVRIRQTELSKTGKALGLTETASQANYDAVVTALSEDCKNGDWKHTALTNLLTARKCLTRLNMFYDTYPNWKHPIDGLIHPQINSCGTETRRPSGSSPNPLQWPKRGEGVKFRRCIIPNQSLGHDLIVSIDWSQQELRVAAALSNDEALLDCYIGKDVEHVLSEDTKKLLGEVRLQRFLKSDTKDVHNQTATNILGMTYDQVVAGLESQDKELATRVKAARTAAKPVNFGSTYGIGPKKLAVQLICSYDEAKGFLEAKKELYEGFEQWKKKVEDTAKFKGYVTTALGNRRHVFEGVLDRDEGMRSATIRQAINYLIQGVCADNLKRTLTEIRNQKVFERTGAVLIAPIYDELAMSVNSRHAVELIMSVHKIMTRDIPTMPVPMLAEPSLGVNFGDQIEVGRFPTPEKIQEAINKAFEVAKAA
jgi:DNA polymerase I-like protein with 3'-5' exonuclease and polymerase domains/5'-3' exonuclease